MQGLGSIGERQRAKSSITQPRIVRVRENCVQKFVTWSPIYCKSSSWRGQSSRSQRDIMLAKINNCAANCPISIIFGTQFDHVIPTRSKLRVKSQDHNVKTSSDCFAKLLIFFRKSRSLNPTAMSENFDRKLRNSSLCVAQYKISQ